MWSGLRIYRDRGQAQHCDWVWLTPTMDTLASSCLFPANVVYGTIIRLTSNSKPTPVIYACGVIVHFAYNVKRIRSPAGFIVCSSVRPLSSWTSEQDEWRRTCHPAAFPTTSAPSLFSILLLAPNYKSIALAIGGNVTLARPIAELPGAHESLVNINRDHCQ